MSTSNPTQSPAQRRRDAAQETDDLQTQMPGAGKAAVGYLTVVDGLGTGQRLPVYAGSNALGRDPAANRIVADFGDATISRSQHAIITFDPARREFGLRPNGHPNPIYLNDQVVTAQHAMRPGDRLKVGQTTFMLTV